MINCCLRILAPKARPFPRGEGAGGSIATGGGRGMREITLDTVQGKDLLKPCVLGGLIQLPCRRVTARIPLQSETALWAISDSFPPGEAILRPFGALGDRRSPHCSSAKQQFILVFQFIQQGYQFILTIQQIQCLKQRVGAHMLRQVQFSQ